MLRGIGLIDPLTGACNAHIYDINPLAVGQTDPTRTFTGLFDTKFSTTRQDPRDVQSTNPFALGRFAMDQRDTISRS